MISVLRKTPRIRRKAGAANRTRTCYPVIAWDGAAVRLRPVKPQKLVPQGPLGQLANSILAGLRRSPRPRDKSRTGPGFDSPFVIWPHEARLITERFVPARVRESRDGAHQGNPKRRDLTLSSIAVPIKTMIWANCRKQSQKYVNPANSGRHECKFP